MSIHPLLPASWLLVLIAACSGCSDEGPTGPPDTGSPLIEVRFPSSATAFDRDSNGLVDLEVAFSDSLSGIDVSSIEVLSSRPLKGPAGSGSSLFEVWRVVRADTTGFVLEETVDNLLPRGRTVLTVAVEDRAGNRVSRTLTLDLPPAARHKVIDLRASLLLTTNVLATPDGRRVYVTTEENDATAISVIDAGRLKWVKTERTTIRGGSHMALDPARNRLYAMSIDHPFLFVFDLASETFLAPIETNARGIGIAVSHTRGKAYIGLEVETQESGLISVVDLDQGVEERVIQLGIGSAGNPGDRMGMNALVFDPDESRLYASTSPSAVQGILVVDPDEGRLLDQIELSPENDEILGGAIDMIRDGDLLVATSQNSLAPQGRLAVVPLADPQAIRFGLTGGQDIPINVAVSPDRRDYAFTAATSSTDHAIKLMDTSTLEAIWEDRPAPPADRRIGIAFRPDGHVFFAAGSTRDPAPTGAPNELTVYLYR
ncbi:MAG: YncE family protein [Gemmatimonadota bacterium]